MKRSCTATGNSRVDFCRWRGFYYQIAKDRIERRLFFIYLGKKPLLSSLYRFLERRRNGFFVRSAVCAFYLWNHLFLRFPRNARYVSMHVLATETGSYRRVFARRLRDIRMVRPGVDVRAIVRASASASSGTIAAADRVAGRFLKKYDLFVVLRAVQYLAYYDRFICDLVPERVSQVFVFTDANPHGRALLHAAAARGIKVCFVSHGEPDRVMPPIACDTAILFGTRSLCRYRNNRSRIGAALYFGHKDIAQTMRPVDFRDNSSVGIFLSKPTAIAATVKLAAGLLKRFPRAFILIRRHPNMRLSRTEVLELCSDRRVRISEGHSLAEDVALCDFVISGDSTIHPHVLLRGRPSFYSRELEEKRDCACDYVTEGMIMEWKEGIAAAEANSFYCDVRLREKVGSCLDLSKSECGALADIEHAIFP